MLRNLSFGLLFGFILAKSGVTHYDTIANMFLLQDAHVMIVMGVGIAVAGIGMFLLQRGGVKTLGGGKLPIEKKPRTPGNLWGGLLFGAGWAITGTCPGTALAQLGEGSLMAIFTIGGILIGTVLFRKYGEAVENMLARKPPSEQKVMIYSE
jgi:uncharacterized membrane protein YedE/YeeE